MAKNVKSGGGTSRVRFIMMEAEIADGGDLAHFTHAIQNALRGPTALQAKRIAVTPPVNGTEQVAEAEVVEDAEVEEVLDGGDAPPTAARPRAPRKPAPKPSIIEFDITTAPALSTLTDPGSNHSRYLVIAAWFHDHRKVEVITANHVFTCYRHLNWPIDIVDFAQPLRELKHRQYFTTPGRGQYAINQLGLAKAAEVGKA